jgi:hypothetical protein
MTFGCQRHPFRAKGGVLPSVSQPVSPLIRRGALGKVLLWERLTVSLANRAFPPTQADLTDLAV